MEKEMLKWVARGVVNQVPRTQDMKPIKVMWVLDLKDDTNGVLIDRRARCVVKGYTQIKGIHYWITRAQVARYESIRMLIAIIASLNLSMFAFDFTGAYPADSASLKLKIPIIVVERFAKYLDKSKGIKKWYFC